MNDRIVHEDLMNLGIVFLGKNDERTFLKNVNDEFAYLVGLEALNHITGSKNEGREIALEDIYKLFEKDPEKCNEIVEIVRTRILLSLKERRRLALGESGKHKD